MLKKKLSCESDGMIFIMHFPINNDKVEVLFKE